MIDWSQKVLKVVLAGLTLTFSGSALLWALGPTSVRAQETERQTPSGLPVPRYVSLKYSDANARSGPGDDHRLLWIYHARGLPVQVVAETSEWRKICDPDGAVAWVHKRLIDGRRMTMRVLPGTLAIHQSPKPVAPILAYMNPRSLAALDRCKKDWCRVRVDDITGWVPAAEVWGIDERPQCR
jgi:SH3-like domain-containing protein